jgi:hypothetical protein
MEGLTGESATVNPALESLSRQGMLRSRPQKRNRFTANECQSILCRTGLYLPPDIFPNYAENK